MDAALRCHSWPRWVVQKGAILAVGTGANATTIPQYTDEALAVPGLALTDAEMAYLSGFAP